MTSDYEVVIGIETHVQLQTRTKLFCGCNNDSRASAPNTNVCPVCLGLPGALPVLNHQAVRLAMRAGVALGHRFEVSYRTKFDRKNYFYPDLPNGYQITQFDQPIVGGGSVQVIDPETGSTFSVGITRAHLEADAGKLTHPAGADYSLVDLNRASTPLIEIVSEPEIGHASINVAAARAKAYATEINNLMRYAEVSDANLYYGNMRFDVNVSVRKPGAPMGTRTETKNLNSFKSVEKTVEYEAHRQIELLEKGERIIQETRGFDDTKQITFSQRTKEDAMDYRYFPEPDLPPIVITQAMIDEAQLKDWQNLPHIRSVLSGELKLSHGDSDFFISEDPILSKLFTMAVVYTTSNKDVTKTNQTMVNLITGLESDARRELVQRLAGVATIDLLEHNQFRMNLGGYPKCIAEIASMQVDKSINSTNSKLLFEKLAYGDDDILAGPKKYADREHMLQQSDSDAVEKIVDEVIAANPQPVKDIASGKQQAMGFLVGQVMKVSKGQANPDLASQIIKKKLGL